MTNICLRTVLVILFYIHEFVVNRVGISKVLHIFANDNIFPTKHKFMKHFYALLLAISGIMLPTQSQALQNVKGLLKNHDLPSIPAQRIQAATGVITETPEGTPGRYARGGGAYYAIMGSVQTAAYEGVSTEIIAGTDGAYYLYNPLSQADTDSYLRLEMEEGKLVAHLPQAVLAGKANNETVTLSLYRMNYTVMGDDEATYTVDPEKDTISWTLTDGIWQMEGGEQNDMILGLGDSEGKWYGYGEFNTSFAPFSDTTVTPPAEMDTQEWSFTYGETGARVSLAMTDNEVFIKGISNVFPDAWIKGHIDGDNVSFASGQYLGIEQGQYHYCYFHGADVETVYDENLWRDVDKFTRNEAAVLTFSDDRQTLSCDQGMMITTLGQRIVLTVETFARPAFKAIPAGMSYIPADPAITTYEPYDEDYEMGAFEFTFPVTNTDGLGLDTSHLFYRVYFDGKPYTFTTEMYGGLEEDTTLIPYGFTDDNFDFMGMGATHTFFIYEEAGVVGVQTVYIDGDNEYASSIISTDNSSITEIGSMEKSDHVQFFDLSGRQVQNPSAGIYIKIDGGKVTKTLIR